MRSGDGTWEREPGLLDQNQQDYATLVTRALGLQSRSPGHLDPRIQLGVNVDDLAKPEFAFLRRAQLWEAYFNRGATVGQRGYAQVKPAPGMVTVVTEIIVNNGNAGGVVVDCGLALINAETAVAPSSFRDARLVGQTSSAVVSGGSNAVPIVPVGPRLFVPPQTTVVYPCEYVLIGGRGASPFLGLSVVHITANLQVDIGFRWSERRALESEL